MPERPRSSWLPNRICSSPVTRRNGAPRTGPQPPARPGRGKLCLARGGAERDLMELAGWTSPQMLTRYGASARDARARRSYDRIMNDTT